LTSGRLITLSRTQFLFVALSLLGLATVCAVALFFPNPVYDFKCKQFDFPGYETAFGFTLGEVEAPSTGGSRHVVLAMPAIDPDAALARSGVRVGDVPRMYHGVSDFCADLAAAADGETVPMQVYNLNDAKAGTEPRREVALRGR
jgi:hypothetical protein